MTDTTRIVAVAQISAEHADVAANVKLVEKYLDEASAAGASGVETQHWIDSRA